MALPQQRIDARMPGDPQLQIRQLEQRLNELQRALSLIFIVQGDPTGVVDAPQGSIALRLDGGALTSFYVNETGGTAGWVAK